MDTNQFTRDYFDSLFIELRHFDAVLPDTTFELFGETFDTPIMTAALSHLDKTHPNGMAELAMGAKLANAVMWAGMDSCTAQALQESLGSHDELDRITATGAKTVKIIKPDIDNNIILKNIEHAEKCGCIAVGMDLDHAFNHKGEYDNIFGEQMAPKTLEEVVGFVKATKLPFIIKGVLSVTDTSKCLKAGVKGIVVSHHHGIQAFAIPPLMILPQIKKASKNLEIFVDCSVETGMDAFKSIALGARAVSVGRALMKPLSEGGADAVAKKILDITAGLKGAMSRTACAKLTDINSSIIWSRACSH